MQHSQTISDPHMSHHAHSALARLKTLLKELEQRADPAAPEASLQADDPTQKSKNRGRTASLGQLIEALDERAYGFLLLLLALPCCLPFVYALPQIVALPMLALAAQLAMGRETPWLPASLRERHFPIAMMHNTVERAEKYGGWIERITHTRLAVISDGVGARIVGALLIIPCASILIPLPLTNTTPGIGVAITALGLIERDGLLIIGGLAIGLFWVFILIFFGAEAVSLAKDWLLTRF
ncbi:MAG: exopolysaccharide biosynthesis protein [bacterium]